MKAIRYVLTAALVALLALPAMAAVTTIFTAKTTTGASTALDTGNAKMVRVQVWRSDDPAASTAVVTIQQSNDNSKWYTVATITNPTGMSASTGDGGEAWSVASMPFTRLYVVSRSAGAISATIEVSR